MEKVVKIDVEEKKEFVCTGDCENCPNRGKCKGKGEGKGKGILHFKEGYRLGFKDGFDMAMKLLNPGCEEGCCCDDCEECEEKKN